MDNQIYQFITKNFAHDEYIFYENILIIQFGFNFIICETVISVGYLA